jgi:hypothetical protein
MSQTMVSHVWRAFGLQPHRAETFKLSRDPAFVDKVRDVVGLYMNPPDRRWCCALTRSLRSKLWRAPRQCCPCAPASWSDAAPTTSAMARSSYLRPPVSPPWAGAGARASICSRSISGFCWNGGMAGAGSASDACAKLTIYTGGPSSCCCHKPARALSLTCRQDCYT